jgi:predicted NBD/HSP70 family sugar kinase
MRQRLGWSVPFLSGNDANYASISEYQAARKTRSPDLRDFLHIKWSSGLGAGLILNGHVHAGFQGYAGEFGHSPAIDLDRPDKPTEQCERCGKLTCVENVASYDAIRRYLAEQSGDKSYLKKHRLEIDLDPAGRGRIEHVAIYIGRGLGPIVNVINPEAVVISGPSHDLHPQVIPRIREGLADTAIGAIASDIDLRVAERRWPSAKDAEGRLVVVHGAMTSVVEESAVAHILSRLTGGSLQPRAVSGTTVAFARSG